MFEKDVCVTGYMKGQVGQIMHVHTSLREAHETQKNSLSW